MHRTKLPRYSTSSGRACNTGGMSLPAAGQHVRPRRRTGPWVSCRWCGSGRGARAGSSRRSGGRAAPHAVSAALRVSPDAAPGELRVSVGAVPDQFPAQQEALGAQQMWEVVFGPQHLTRPTLWEPRGRTWPLVECMKAPFDATVSHPYRLSHLHCCSPSPGLENRT